MFLSNKTLQLIFFAFFFIQINTYLVQAKDTNAEKFIVFAKIIIIGLIKITIYQ